MKKIYILISRLASTNEIKGIINSFESKKDAEKAAMVLKSHGDFSKKYEVITLDLTPTKK